MEQEEIKQQLEVIFQDAQKKKEEIKNEFDALIQTRDELKNKVANIRSLHTNADNKEKEISQLALAAQQSKKILDESQIKVEQLKKETEEYFKKFTEIRIKLDDEGNGLDANLDWSQRQRDEIDKKHQEVTKLQAQSENLKQEIEAFKEQISKIKEESEQLKISISDTLNLVTTTSLTGSFIERRDILAGKKGRWYSWFSGSTKKWFWGLLISIVLLGLSFLYIYQTLVRDGLGDWHLLYRYLVASPFIYLVYVCVHNYNLERNYEERYAFKAVLATSLESYIKLFSDKFPEEKEKLLKFMLETISTIYKEPYSDKDETKEAYGGFKNIFNFGFKNNKKGSSLENKEIIE